MKIGGFEVGPWAMKEEGGKKNLIFACKDCVYGATLSDDPHCRFHILTILQQSEADLIVLADVYERVYNESQTKMLTEISSLVQKFKVDAPWSYSKLGNPKAESEADFGERHDAIIQITQDLLMVDPIKAYIRCLQEIKRESLKGEAGERKTSPVYLTTLTKIKNEFESTQLISLTKQYLLKLKEIPETTTLYHSFLEAEIKPSFIGSRLMFGEVENFELLDEYSVGKSQVQVFNHPNKVEKLYFINPPEYSLTPQKYFLLSKTKEIVATYKPVRTSLSSIAESRKYFERIYQSTIRDLANSNQIPLDSDEVVELAEMVARYTVGYGILELLLNDRKITDIYLDSPIGQKPLYLVHGDYGFCTTNVLYTESEADALVSKLRAMSGRPFDEAHPVLDFDLPGMETRIAAIGPPLSPTGLAFAFRLHKVTPWTLPQFIENRYLTPLAAGLLTFLIDQKVTMLVTGSRGSGKTSLLGAILLEILQNNRILVQEDTLEIPVPYMKEIGFNIQRMKTRSAISVSQSETEVAPEEALRTALRLGDSALVIGEVRSNEAKVLYEAMRIGAAGSTVIGTIHADSAYSVWDRVVNDLGVPTTSFKATDVVVVARPIRLMGSLKSTKRVTEITEVKKHWVEDPEREKGLLNLMEYDAKKDSLEWVESAMKESELFEKVKKVSGLSYDMIWQTIQMHAGAKAFMVELKQKYKLPQLLEAEHTVAAHNKFALMKEKQIEENGSVDFRGLLEEWKKWMEGSFVRRVIEKSRLQENS